MIASLELSEDAEHLKHRFACRRGGIEALLMHVEIDLEPYSPDRKPTGACKLRQADENFLH